MRAEGARSAENEALRNIEREKQAKKEIPEHVYRNADEIRRYLDAEEFAHKGTAPAAANLESDRRSESSLPLSMRRIGVLDKGAEDDTGDVDRSRRLINAALDAQKNYSPSKAAAIERVREDPGVKMRWAEGKMPRLKARYEAAMRDAAEFIERIAPGFRLRVVTHPEQEVARTKRQAQKLDTRDADAAIVRALERIEREEGPMERRVAIDLLIQRRKTSEHPIGGARILWAIRRENARKGEGEGAA
jgi:hypothetical protein